MRDVAKGCGIGTTDKRHETEAGIERATTSISARRANAAPRCCQPGGSTNRWSYEPGEAVLFKIKEAAEETADMIQAHCALIHLPIPELKAVLVPCGHEQAERRDQPRLAG